MLFQHSQLIPNTLSLGMGGVEWRWSGGSATMGGRAQVNAIYFAVNLTLQIPAHFHFMLSVCSNAML